MKNYFFITSIFLLSFVSPIIQGRRHTIFWDAHREPGLKEGLKVEVQVNDWMDILCPQKTGINRSFTDDAGYYLELFNVSAEHYKHCAVTGQRRLLHCKDPRQETKLTTKFQTRSPSPIGFVFRPGETYYYLSKPLHKNKGGCANGMLRMEITVQNKLDYKRTIFHHSKSQGSSHFRYHNHDRQKNEVPGNDEISSQSTPLPRKIGQVAPSSEKKNPENRATSTLFHNNFFILSFGVLTSYIASNYCVL